MSSAWTDLVNSDGSDEHLELCNAALIQVQKTEQVRALRLVANALSVMAGNKVPTMDTVDIVARARDLLMETPSGISLEKALEDAQKAL